ncbi:helix-turn-helix domain-containing protein [Pontiella sulfatireligans]|uniref:Antitoxin HigA n=1 Tax=Pontiella sulfatireligans TaxID=2750658 RepID=A0A6C2UNQ2_9BACT|nr:DNA-binding protein [Pontiella sulfatireligans]VGO20944.1 Antitoxin HigA [Pontiella sulfatireligans]
MKARVIKTEKENDEALARIEQLMELEPSPEVVDEIELLSTLVELYEDKAYPVPFLNPLDAIRFRMEQQELKQKDLIPYIGSKSKVSEVLAGKRSLSLSMVRRLHEGLGIPLDVLLGSKEIKLGMVAEEPLQYRTRREDP